MKKKLWNKEILKNTRQKGVFSFSISISFFFLKNEKILKKSINTGNKWHCYHFGKGCIEQKRDKKGKNDKYNKLLINLVP